MKKLTVEEVTDTLQAAQDIQEIMNEDTELASQVKFEFEKFARNMYNGRAFNPWSQMDLMKNQNLHVRTPSDEKEIMEALANPTSNESQLIGFNQGYYFSSFMYKRNLEYMANLPAFDLELTCYNAKSDDYKTKEYKEDYEKIKDFLNKFDYRNEFRKAYWQTLMEETFYCFTRDLGDKIILEPWPFKYAQLTGRFNHGFLYDIDMQYFMQPYVDLDLYPTWVKKKYNEIFKSDGSTYVPSNDVNKRTGSFATWVQTSPEDGAFAFKFTDKHNAQVPFFTGMLPEMAMIPVLRKLQESQSMAAAHKMIVSSIPYLNEKKGSSVANQIAIDPATLGLFMSTLKHELADIIRVAAMPTEDIKGIEFNNTDKDTYKNFMDVASSLLSGGKAIFAPGHRQNALQTQLSLDLDRQLSTSGYGQYEEFLNYYANKETSKYKWKFKFVGTNDWLDREQRQKEARAAADQGLVLPNKIASSLGMNKIELEQELEEMDASGFCDKLRLMLNTNTTSGEDINDSGRPVKDDNELSDGGLATRDNASNIDKGGKT